MVWNRNKFGLFLFYLLHRTNSLGKVNTCQTPIKLWNQVCWQQFCVPGILFFILLLQKAPDPQPMVVINQKNISALCIFCLATFATQYINVGPIFPNSLPWYYSGKFSSSFEIVGRSGFYRPVLIRSFQFGERGTRWNMQYWRKIKFLQIYFHTGPLTLALRLSCLFKTQKRTRPWIRFSFTWNIWGITLL